MTWRTFLPHSLCGQHAVAARAWQLVGGRSWSLVLITRIEQPGVGL